MSLTLYYHMLYLLRDKLHVSTPIWSHIQATYTEMWIKLIENFSAVWDPKRFTYFILLFGGIWFSASVGVSGGWWSIQLRWAPSPGVSFPAVRLSRSSGFTKLFTLVVWILCLLVRFS